MESEIAARESTLASKDDVRDAVHRLELKLEGFRTEVIRWNFAFWVAQLAAIAAMLKLVR